MTKKSIFLRNVVAIAICLAGTMMFSGCDPKEDEPGGGNPVTPPTEAVELTSPITQDRHLTNLNNGVDYVYKGSGLLEVTNNAKLTIDPGVTIQFTNTGGTGGMEIHNGATIKAVGLPKLLDAQGNVVTVNGVELDGHIKFIGVGSAIGSWDMISLYGLNTANEFAYCDFINGGMRTDAHNYPAVIVINQSKVSITHCTVSGGKVHGIALWDNSELTAFNNNKVENCAQAPVFLQGELSLLSKFDMTSDFTNNTKKYIEVYPAQFLAENATLNQTSVPYFFNREFNIGSYNRQSRLTINEGVTIYMGNNTYISDSYGNGALTINGSASKVVTFTRMPDANYYWRDIRFEGGLGHIINNCVLEYGGRDDVNGILTIAPASLTMSNVIIRNSYKYGVSLFGDNISVTHSNITFANNSGGNVIDNRVYPPQVLEQLP